MKMIKDYSMMRGYVLAVQPTLDDAYSFQANGCEFKYPLLGRCGGFTCKFDDAKKYQSLEELSSDFMNLKTVRIPLQYEIIVNEIDIENLHEIEKEHKRRKALAKLTDEEKELLGLI